MTSAEKMKALRARQSEEKKKAELERNRLRNLMARSAESQEETARRLELDRLQHAEARQRLNEENLQLKKACHNSDIFSGNLFFPEISQSPESLGKMDFVCEHCGACKFRTESVGLCCLQGKVQLPKFPDPPPVLREYWHGNFPSAKLFRKHCRSINNAVCLTSLQVRERRLPGFNPSVIFQGRVFQRLGPLLPEPGIQPKFAQLYVLDPQLERTERFNKLSLPAGMSEIDKNGMRSILEEVQGAIHDNNPYVQDFKQILDLPEEDLDDGKIVISASARPAEGHARVYNAQENLQELRVVTNERPHDLVVHLRSGELSKVSDLNPKAMSLHFTLLFVNGTTGWDQHMQQTSGKRVSPREYIAYQLQKRQTGSDYIFRAERLFQEYILTAYTTMENQRLAFMKQNQGTLRSDCYRNVQDVVQERREEAAAGGDALYNGDVG